MVCRGEPAYSPCYIISVRPVVIRVDTRDRRAGQTHRSALLRARVCIIPSNQHLDNNKCIFIFAIFILNFKIMARPIADTPILRGKDAKRFREAMENVQPLPAEERERMRKAYELAKQRATFYLP